MSLTVTWKRTGGDNISVDVNKKRNSSPKISNGQQGVRIVCYKCNKLGHKASECYSTASGASGQASKSFRQEASFQEQRKTTRDSRRDTKQCYVCGKLGHFANECWKNNGPPRVPLRGQQKAAVAMEMDRDRMTDAQVHRFQHSLSHCSTCQCMSVPEATCCVAEITTVPSSSKSTEFKSSNGKVYQVCHLQCDKTIPFCSKDNLPTSPAVVNHQMVTLLRDTGCTGVIVSKQLVQESQYTGKSKLCQMIDGSIIKVPIAEITIDSPYYKGKTDAMVMATPVFDLILGNIQGAKSIVDADCKWTATHDDKGECISLLQTASQAITRSMSQKLEKPLKLLKVPDIKPSVTPKMQNFIAEQEQDATLEGVWEKAKDPEARPKVTKNAETRQSQDRNSLQNPQKEQGTAFSTSRTDCVASAEAMSLHGISA